MAGKPYSRTPMRDEARLAAAEAGRKVFAEMAAQQLKEFIEDVSWMALGGETTVGAAERLGIKTPSLNKRLYNNDRSDLWERLKANEVERYGETLAERLRREDARDNPRGGRRSLQEAS